MSTLHILSHSPHASDRLDSCLRLLAEGDGLLLCGDAVYALAPGSRLQAQLQALAPAHLYALAEDLQARGLQATPAQALDYPGFVERCTAYDKVNGWL